MESKELETQPNVLDRLPFNLTQLVAFAMQKPRDPAAAMDAAIAQLRAMPQFASKAYYSIPFKRKDGTQEIVEGPSIKAATALTGCWGNNIEGCFMGQETEDYIDVQGYFFDYETGKLTIRPWRVSKTYRTSGGDVVKWRYDMLQKQLAAGVSKAIRNADLNGLPIGYIAEYYAEAKRIAARGGKIQEGPKQNPADDMKAIALELESAITKLEKWGVERPEIEQYVGRHVDLSTEEAVVAHLIGLLNALDEGQVTIDEVFTVSDAPIPAPQRTKPAENVSRETTPPPTTAPPAPAKAFQKGKIIHSTFAGGKCTVCQKPINKGDALYKNAKYKWVHEATC